ncbi:MAG: SGNH/GDSL hydrolase family protein [Candidatus Omnitrophota bacterium]|nr:SGNH/GDSL hydrolase family protein [Candidatus Omnitrophota bacterium]
MRKRKLLSNLALSLVTVLAFLFLSELTLRFFYPVIKSYDLEMWRYSLSGKILIKNNFHENKPNSYLKNIYGVDIKINSKGLRDYEYDYSKPSGVYRILVLGDSLTLGWGVPFEYTYPKYLEKMLNETGNIKYQVINAGVGNYNLQSEVMFLKKEGLKYNPDMIILGYFVNDAEILRPTLYFLNRHSYLYTYIWSKFNILKAKFFKKNYKEYYQSLYKKGSKTKEQFEALAEELKQIVREKNIPLLVLLLPELHNLKEYAFEDIHAYVRNIFKDCPIIDMLSYFDRNLPFGFYWVSKEDPHYNQKAHKIVSENLFLTLMKLKNN